ncbi:hypothetical protein H6F77_12810 [Microcoleus sp. FACHB-831]|uniref:DUF6753 family protein n=1 Tax=Microcoleus sp. FACHB-831 TaxID=2692827 RepID=UPI001682B80B|nr:DUF6753 family protein [Microcoleus sp. FACHB-831]MBD1921966.1 hypothetical protein [Microcoleus sp. FACHB-831]
MTNNTNNENNEHNFKAQTLLDIALEGQPPERKSRVLELALKSEINPNEEIIFLLMIANGQLQALIEEAPKEWRQLLLEEAPAKIEASAKEATYRAEGFVEATAKTAAAELEYTRDIALSELQKQMLELRLNKEDIAIQAQREREDITTSAIREREDIVTSAIREKEALESLKAEALLALSQDLKSKRLLFEESCQQALHTFVKAAFKEAQKSTPADNKAKASLYIAALCSAVLLVGAIAGGLIAWGLLGANDAVLGRELIQRNRGQIAKCLTDGRKGNKSCPLFLPDW